MPVLSDEEDDPQRSSFRLELSLSIGYQRRRARVEGAWEGRLITVVLLLAGALLVLFVIYEIFTRVFG